MGKKVFWSIVVVLLLATSWYLFLKPEDYLARLRLKTSQGTINQTLKLWASTLDNSEVLEQRNLNSFKHRLKFNDSLFVYNWKIEKENDSITKLEVGIKDINNSLMNRLTMPFSNTDFEKRCEKTVLNLHENLKEHLDKFRVTIVDIDSFESTFCACIPAKSGQIEKAAKMKQDFPLLEALVIKSNMVFNNSPFIEITDWNIENDSIAYNFCYPIIKPDSLPKNEDILFKTFKGFRGLKAIYNGNYITSDRAWYALLEHAEQKNYRISMTPVEVFHTSPGSGKNELEWVAEIYMPLKGSKTE